MSESSIKGKSLEEFVAKTLRKKLGVQVARDKRSGAGSHQKMDISDYFKSVPLDIECKNHKTIKPREWYAQAKAGASVGQIPTVIFNVGRDEAALDVVAMLPFESLVDIMAELKQVRDELADLRKPVELQVENDPAKLVEKAVKRHSGVKTCRNGHIIAPGQAKCLMKGCPYSAGYKPKKEKK